MVGNKKRRGGDDTRLNIANARRSAQFSLGKANLLLKPLLASDFWNFFRTFFDLPFLTIFGFFKHFQRAPNQAQFYPLYIQPQSPEKWRMPIRRSLPLLWLLLCFLCTAISTFAAGPADSPFIINSWNVENGLPDNEAISILQARDGYLWIGTLHGLVRFDGSEFTTFNEMNTPGLKNDRVVFLYEDHETNLWIGTQTAGLAVIQNGKITDFETETASAGPITSAQEDSSGIFFYSRSGTMRYQNGKMNFLRNIYSQQSMLLTAHLLAPSRDGGYWELWNGIQKRNGQNIEKNFGPTPWGNTFITATYEDEKGNLIVGTLGEGIFWFDADGHHRQITQADGLSSDFVLSLCLDDEGNLWVGTDGAGLNRIKKKIFTSPENFHPWAVQSIAQDAAGGLWAAFGASGASYWRSNISRDYQLGETRQAWEILVDHQNRIWAGSQAEGLFLFGPNRFSPVLPARVQGLKEIFALFESRDGTLWVGSHDGLGHWDGQQWKLLTTHDGLSENSIRAIAEDSNSNLWIGTENSGLDYFDGNKVVSTQTTTNGLPGNDISCLYADNDGVLWVGTAGHGLARFENGKWESFSTANGLVSDSIGYIIGDNQGYLWIGSNRGLMRIQKNALAQSGGTNSFFCRVYGQNDGLPTRECSSGSEPAAIQTHDGKLLFPTSAGLVSIDPATIKTNLSAPQVLIESARIGSIEQNTNPLNSAWSQTIIVPPGAEQLEIHYTALNFTAPEEVRFKYRLEGHESEWVDAGDFRVARFTALLPGHYRFHVIACNEDGTWNQTGAYLNVEVLPQFWQTPVFQLAVVLFAAVIIIGIVRYISTQKLQREVQALKHQEALERERGRIARDLHDQIGANLTQVALLGELAEADKNLPEEIESHSKQISQTARETTRSLDEIVWAVNPSNDTLEGLANYACKYASEYLALANLPCRMDVPPQLPATAIKPDVRHNVFLAFKEAVHNVVKHSHATEVWIRLRLQPNRFTFQIQDNGRGITNQGPTTRNGLRNMKKRLTDIGGDFSISSGANGGTLVELTVPLA
jgi:ligand-binding sensor domain-containing protein/signal transduction histidine kinase